MRRKFTDPKKRLPGRPASDKAAKSYTRKWPDSPHSAPGRRPGSTNPNRKRCRMTNLPYLMIFNPRRLQKQLDRIEKKVDTIMTAVQIQQEDLDQFAADITAATAAISTEIDNLVASASNTLTEADVTALQTAVSGLDALSPPQINPL